MEGGAAGPTTVLGRSRGGGRSGAIKDAAAKCFGGGGNTSGGVEKWWQQWSVKGDSSVEQELAVMVGEDMVTAVRL